MRTTKVTGPFCPQCCYNLQLYQVNGKHQCPKDLSPSLRDLAAAAHDAGQTVKISLLDMPKPGLTTDPVARKQLQLYTFMFEYFPLAWLEVVRVARLGNDQHNPGQPLHWAREKSTDQMNALFNHLFDYGLGQKRDTSGSYHLANLIWRASAQLQLDIEKENGTDTRRPSESGDRPAAESAQRVLSQASAEWDGSTGARLPRRPSRARVRHRGKGAR